MGRRPTSITEEYGEVDSRQTLWVKAPHVTDAAQHPLPIPALVNGSIPPKWQLAGPATTDSTTESLLLSFVLFESESTPQVKAKPASPVTVCSPTVT